MAYFVGIAGTHSTGKSTFIQEIKKKAEEQDISVIQIGDSATKCRDKGFPILEDHTFESTLWIIVSVIQAELEAELKADLILIDRPVLDALGYLEAALEFQKKNLTSKQKEYLYNLVKSHSYRYDLLLKTTLDESIPIGEGRPENMNFRRNAALKIDSVFENLGVSYLSPSENEAQISIQNIFDLIASNQK
ncbi:hypothetical protein VFES401_00720 [Aliivibrio fischeri]|uniref:AAA family ATPase n=1 Tax=Aliivibrio fischeri TaxID=668 RepID=UPI00107E81ED|nr:AAA family ATPase [Aliivibrio fischeri]TGA73269.1 hypothetical protein VFES401_00720 [Aliivibrio fischeri]